MDWEIFVGLAKAFAAHTGKELKPTMAPAQMIDNLVCGWGYMATPRSINSR